MPIRFVVRWGTFALLSVCWGIHRVAFRIDDWLYPAIREVPVDRPLFVVGLPRSGTTFLHRLIACEDETFTTFRLWELLFAPAVCQKRFIRGVWRLDQWLGGWGEKLVLTVERRVSGSLHEVHSTTLQSPEEDFLSLLPFGGCFLRVLAHPHSEQVWDLGHFCERLTAAEQQRLATIYRGMVQRHLYFHGTNLRLLSKNPTFTAWVPALEREFPSARFLGIRRTPLESVPSQLSSLRSGFNFFWKSRVRTGNRAAIHRASCDILEVARPVRAATSRRSVSASTLR